MRLNTKIVLVLLFLRLTFMFCSDTNIIVAIIVQKNIWPHFKMENSTLKTEKLTMFKVTVVTESNFQDGVDIAFAFTKENVHGFIFYTDCNAARILDKMALFTHVPSIVMTRDLCDIESDHMIQFQPSCKRCNALIADFAFNRRWTDLMLFFDENLNQRCMTDLIRKLSLNPTSTRLVNINNYNSAEEYLSFLYRYHPDAVVMLASKETLETTLTAAAKVNVNNYKWILMTGDSVLPRLNHTLFKGERILFISPKSKAYDMDIYQDSLDTSDMMNGQDDEAALWMFEFYSKVASTENVSSLEPLSCRHLSNVPHRDNVVRIAKQIHTQVIYEYELCSVKSVGKIKEWINQGVWTQKTGFRLVNDKMFANNFEDFGYATLKVAVLPTPPFTYSEKDSNNITLYTGFCIDILDELASRFKFKYELVEPPDAHIGSQNENGTWTGMIGMTQRKEVDFAVDVFTITSAREEVIDFTTTIMEVGIGILTKRPQSEANKEYKVFKPLSVQVWALIGVAIVLVGIMFYAVNKISPYYRDKTQDENPENQLDLNTSFWLIYGTFFELDVPGYRPKSWSGRAMLGLWWIFIILMLAAYTAQLAAYLTVSIIEPPINSLDELASQDTVKPLWFEGTNLFELFETGKSSTYRKMLDKISEMPRLNFDSFDEALHYVKSGQYALMTDDFILEYVVSQDCTTFALAEETFNKAGLGFVLQENAHYLEAFNFAIMKMAEGGLIGRWRKKWFSQDNSCKTTNVVGSAHALDMDSLLGLFYAYLWAIGISTVVFVVEVICRTKRVGRMRNNLAGRFRAPRRSLHNRPVFTPNAGEIKDGT